MQNKIKDILKKFSFITEHPDVDWQKLFLLLGVLAVISLGWNVYFYFAVKADIAASEQSGQKQASTVGNVQEDQIKAVIEQYGARQKTNESIIQAAPSEVADPAGA